MFYMKENRRTTVLGQNTGENQLFAGSLLFFSFLFALCCSFFVLRYWFFALCYWFFALCYWFFALRYLFPDSQHLLAQSQLRIVADHYHGPLLRFALQQFAQEPFSRFV